MEYTVLETIVLSRNFIGKISMNIQHMIFSGGGIPWKKKYFESKLFKQMGVSDLFDLLIIWPWPFVYFPLIFRLFHLDLLFISPWSIVYFTLIFCLFHLEFLVISPWSLVYFTLIFCWFPLDYGSYILDYSLNWFWNILLFVLDPSSHS